MSTSSQKYGCGAQQRDEILKKELSISNMQVAYEALGKTAQHESAHGLGQKGYRMGEDFLGCLPISVPQPQAQCLAYKGEIDGQEKNER